MANIWEFEKEMSELKLSDKTNAAATEFQFHMKVRLAEKQDKYGDDWDEPGDAVTQRLRLMLERAVNDRKWLHVANFAMFLWFRESRVNEQA